MRPPLSTRASTPLTPNFNSAPFHHTSLLCARQVPGLPARALAVDLRRHRRRAGLPCAPRAWRPEQAERSRTAGNDVLRHHLPPEPDRAGGIPPRGGGEPPVRFRDLVAVRGNLLLLPARRTRKNLSEKVSRRGFRASCTCVRVSVRDGEEPTRQSIVMQLHSKRKDLKKIHS